ncbi:glycosyltransferase family 2 protein [Labilibaculum sp.]|uniref:glycosyltransferase family 2 protein n=1 Tax=Labilibaculum sp. TaxID=2060723 RepID=UPI002AA82A08|nr:glycosyltransferase family 2 protein [Labilibaculum sp.]
MKNNKVSIITPSYNSSHFIQATIQSVLKQTYTDWEMIIVDDCSKDKSIELINSLILNDDRIQLIALETNVGAAEARNIALRKAKGRFIAFLDSDDVWYPQKLGVQLDFMIRNNYEFTFSSYDLMSEDGIKLNKVINVPNTINYHQYLRNTIIGCLTVIIDKEKVGYFEMPNIKSSHDMALWLLIMKRGFKAHGINELLASYRLVSNSNTAKKWKAAADVWKVYRKIENLSLIKAVYSFVGYACNALLKRF